MDLARVAAFAVGLALVGWTLLSAIRTVVLPRAAQSILSRPVFRVPSSVFRLLAGERASFPWRDRVWALFSPVALLSLAGTWVVLVELEVRAGTPPSAEVFITRLAGIGRLDQMESAWLEWETWSSRSRSHTRPIRR